jgi:TnpA family transposase
MRRRVHTGLDKGEAHNALARAVFFNRLGESVIAVSSSSAIARAASTW